MMRKIFGFLLMLSMIFGMVLPCNAAENNKALTGDVYARYVSTVKWDDIVVTNGSVEVTLDNGYTISVTGAPSNGEVLRVVPISSEETVAWNWFTGCISSDVTIISVFDIYFLDANGNRINADGVNISIAGVDDETTVFAVSTDGSATELDCIISNRRIANRSISFTANGSHYYVLAKKVENSNDYGNNVDIEKPESDNVEIKDENPKTVDNSYIGLWSAALVLSIIALSGLVERKYKKRSFKN